MSVDEVPFNLRVKDVYDFAIEIAEGFEKVVDVCGIEEVSVLINKVISVLEYLEASVNKIEFAEKEIAHLKLTYARLSGEKAANNEGKVKLEKEFEEIEESWIQESLHLKAIISKLQEENKQLQSQLKEKYGASQDDISYKAVILDQEEFIMRLNTNIQERESKLQKCIGDIDSLNVKIEQLNDHNKDLHLHYQKSKKEIELLREEKRNLEANIYKQERKMSSLEKSLSDFLQKKCDQTEHLTEDDGHSIKDLLNLASIQDKQKDEIEELQLKLNSAVDDAEFYKNKYLRLTCNENQKNFRGTTGIRRLFHLFLGFVSIKPEVLWI